MRASPVSSFSDHSKPMAGAVLVSMGADVEVFMA
jgi:hypothetical protein